VPRPEVEFAAFFAFDDYMKAYETTGVVTKCGLATIAGVVLFDEWKIKYLRRDDEAYILESVKYVVQKEGYLVVTGDDGEKALALAREHKPDLMFLDVEMPKKTGYEVAATLKSEPETRHIYIIMLTARGQAADEKKGYESQVNEYITKPFSPRKLAKRLHEILDDWQADGPA